MAHGQGVNARDGLPKIRAEWVAKRDARGDKVQTQQHYAKQGIITEEMAFCAARERIDAEFIRSEVTPGVLTHSHPMHMQVPSTLKLLCLQAALTSLFMPSFFTSPVYNIIAVLVVLLV